MRQHDARQSCSKFYLSQPIDGSRGVPFQPHHGCFKARAHSFERTGQIADFVPRFYALSADRGLQVALGDLVGHFRQTPRLGVKDKSNLMPANKRQKSAPTKGTIAMIPMKRKRALWISFSTVAAQNPTCAPCPPVLPIWGHWFHRWFCPSRIILAVRFRAVRWPQALAGLPEGRSPRYGQ